MQKGISPTCHSTGFASLTGELCVETVEKASGQGIREDSEFRSLQGPQSMISWFRGVRRPPKIGIE
jgi:hypothetical protein